LRHQTAVAIVRDRLAPELFASVGGTSLDAIDFEVVDAKIAHHVGLRSCAVSRGKKAFLALYLTNNYLVFQFRSDAQQSRMCKYVEWLPGDNHRILQMEATEVEMNAAFSTALDDRYSPYYASLSQTIRLY
jgi:hypothetical protein